MPAPHSTNIGAPAAAAKNRYDCVPSSRTAINAANTYVDITTQQQRQYGTGKTGDHYVSVADAI